MKKILYLTDLYYDAKGRDYYKEDLFITEYLKDYFDLVLCNPRNSKSFESDVDLIIFRNTGPVSEFSDVYNSFVERVKSNNLKTFNEFKGKADMCGKQYLIDLTLEGFPVIPTIDSLENFDLLPQCDKFVIKPNDGADSIGLEFLTKDELFNRELEDMLIQPAVDFKYEVSFYK
jgi:glutathione synthase/RimK-type ligase-like ATP-grasp enzyme